MHQDRCRSDREQRRVSPGSRSGPEEEPAKLAINPNTVLKAYRDLEREGLVKGRPGMGTFVIRSLPGTDPAAQQRFLAAMTGLLRSARSAGLGPDDIESIYRTAVRNCFTEEVA